MHLRLQLLNTLPKSDIHHQLLLMSMLSKSSVIISSSLKLPRLIVHISILCMLICQVVTDRCKKCCAEQSKSFPETHATCHSQCESTSHANGNHSSTATIRQTPHSIKQSLYPLNHPDKYPGSQSHLTCTPTNHQTHSNKPWDNLFVCILHSHHKNPRLRMPCTWLLWNSSCLLSDKGDIRGKPFHPSGRCRWGSWRGFGRLIGILCQWRGRRG